MKRLLLLLILITTLTTLAEVRYVSKTGTSTPPYLTWETACDSIQKCINICNDGDTIYVANGVYRDTLVIEKIIWLIGSSMDSTIIDGTGLAVRTIYIKDPIIGNLGGSVENFTILGKGYNQGAGIITDKALKIKNCRILNDQIGISVSLSASYIENVIISNVQEGIYGGCSTGGCSNYLKNSLILIDDIDGTGVWTGLNGTYYISDNIILFTGARYGIDGIAVAFDGQVYIYNNIVSRFGINIYKHDILDTTFIYNNILIGREGSYGVTSYGDPVIINNNIFKNSTTAIRVDTLVKSNYNLFWENAINSDRIPLGDSDIIADPMFVKDTTMPDTSFNFDFHLQAFSPAIDRGNPDILDKDSTRSDIGAYGGPFGSTYIYKDFAPREPRGITGVVDSNKIAIKWARNTEADLSKYLIYRDTIPNFKADSSKLISEQADTFFVSIVPYENKKYYYKLKAKDNQGNLSELSEEIVQVITDVNEPSITPLSYKLYQNYPNPFNPTTKIGYQLKERGYVKLMLYDIKGELIKTLINKEMEAGYYETEFTANNLSSGIYLYRIEIIGEGTIPKYSDMKKMVLIK